MMGNHSDHRRHEQPGQDNPGFSFKSVNWGRLFSYLKPYRSRMALAILALLLSTGFGLAFPLVIIRLLTSATQVHTYGPLNMLAGVLIGIFLLQAAFSFVQS
jgi:subfamily B ATP-binding cassette protein MsbA